MGVTKTEIFTTEQNRMAALAKAIIKMAAEMAFSREVIGVHYPSDSDVSRVWARRFVNELLKQPRFQADLAKAKAEIAAKRSLANR